MKKRTLFAILSLSFTFLLCSLFFISALDWPTLRGNFNRTGYQNVDIDLLSLDLQWNLTVADGFTSSSVVSNDILYIGDADNNFYALNATTGSQMWNYTLGGAVLASATVYDGVVYIGDFNDKFFALNAVTGTQIWNYTAPGGQLATAAVANGIVYFGGLGLLL